MDYSTALPLIRAAAKGMEKGVSAAQYLLGAMYAHGEGGLKKDLRASAAWMQTAASQGHQEARDHLSKLRDAGVFPSNKKKKTKASKSKKDSTSKDILKQSKKEL